MVFNKAFINLDPCGLFCFFLIYLMLFYSDWAFVYWFMLDSNLNLWKIGNIVFYQVTITLLIWSHFKASFTNPGHFLKTNNNNDLSSETLMFLKNFNQDKNWNWCERCKIYCPPKVYHCQICQRCIRKMHHHCHWINNCVGKFNKKFFIQFLFYVQLICFYTILIVIIELFYNPITSQAKAIHMFILLIESFLFGIFGINVFSDQVQASVKNTPAFEYQSPTLFLTKLCETSQWLFWILPLKYKVRKYHQFIL